MKIDSIRKISKKGSKMRGIASIILENDTIISDIRIIEGENGLFIAFPSPRFSANKEYDDMSEEEKQENNLYMKNLKGIDKLVIDEFNRIKDNK